MINDLKTPDVSTLMWKFADDSTVSEAIPPCHHSKLQPAVEHISTVDLLYFQGDLLYFQENPRESCAH